MGEWLRRLDRAVLPPIARVLGRLSRGSRRSRPLTFAAMLSVVAVLLVAVWTADRAPLAGPARGDVVRVGVASGASVPGYIGRSRRRLAALLAAHPDGSGSETYALISLRAYVAPGRLTVVLAGAAVSRVYARVPLPHRQTEIVRIDAYRVPDDVVAGMRAEAARKDAQARDYRARAARLGGSETWRRRVYTTGAAVAADEATAYRRLCSCVYAAVVRATPAVLDVVSRRSAVRAVDPAPAVLRLDRAVFLPPLPEQVDRAVPPDDTALDPWSPAAGGPTLAPAASAGSGADPPPAGAGPVRERGADR